MPVRCFSEPSPRGNTLILRATLAKRRRTHRENRLIMQALCQQILASSLHEELFALTMNDVSGYHHARCRDGLTLQLSAAH